MLEVIVLLAHYYCFHKDRFTAYKPHRFNLEEYYESLSKYLNQKTKYYLYDSFLGWKIKPNGENHYYKTDENGNRSVDLVPWGGTKSDIRIATFGGTLTHSSFVANGFTWQDSLSNIIPKIEILNFGVHRYGIDQSLLRFKNEVESIDADIAILGFIPDEIGMTVNSFLPFFDRFTEIPLGKPRFMLEDNKLLLQENLISKLSGYNDVLERPRTMINRLGKNDFHYQQNNHYGLNVFPSIRFYRALNREPLYDYNRELNPDSEAFTITTRIIDDFYETAVKNDIYPILVLFPDILHLTRFYNLGEEKFTSLKNYLNSKRYQYVDLHNHFRLYDDQIRRTYYTSRVGHDNIDQSVKSIAENYYSMLAYDVIGNYMAYYLETNKLDNQESLKILLADMKKYGNSHFGDLPLSSKNMLVENQKLEAEEGYILNTRSEILEQYGYKYAQLLNDKKGTSGHYVVNGNLLYDVFVHEPGTYKLEAKLLTAGTGSNSLYVQMSGSSLNTWHIYDYSPKWKWQVSDFSWKMKTGRYTLAIGFRENMPIDKLKLVKID